MKVLVLSTYGEIVDICRRLKNEGNEVDLFIKDFKCKKIGDGVVNKIDSIKSYDYDLIIFDDTGWGDLPIKLREKGFKVIGGNVVVDNLEIDRKKFYDLCNFLGIKVPKTFYFNNVDDAIKHIKKFPNQYVLKSFSSDKSITYISKKLDSSDLIQFLKHHTEINRVYLQHKIRGYEVALSCFFNGREFIPPLIINFEHKRLGNNNVGIFTGEMGTVLFYNSDLGIKFFKETLKKFNSILLNNYVGIIDINCIVNTSGIYALELTPRFGYPITNILSSNIKSYTNLFTGLVNYEYDAVLRNILDIDSVSIGVVVCALTLEDKNVLLNTPLVGLTDLNNFSIYGLYFKNNMFFINDTYVGVVIYTAKNLNLAIQGVYELVEKYCIPDLLYYRTDIGQDVHIKYKWLKGIKLFKPLDN